MSGKIIVPPRRVYIVSSGTAVGHEENAGPLGGKFDVADTEDDRFGMDSYEKSEAQMQKVALEYAIKKAGLCEDDVEVIFAGDLLNQCVSSAYAYAENEIPFLGLFGACSTAAQGLLTAAVFASFAADCAAAVTSSHNCTSERQFRFPLEYGAQRPPTAQWTVTGAGAFIVCAEGSTPSDRGKPDEGGPCSCGCADKAYAGGNADAGGTHADRGKPYEGGPCSCDCADKSYAEGNADTGGTHAGRGKPAEGGTPSDRGKPAGFNVEIAAVLPGISRDYGINDANDMGAAMAPAAADTILRYLSLSGTKPEDYSMIATGDLGLRGSELLRGLCESHGVDISGVHTDCGVRIYDIDGQDKHSGGSGCGCSAVVLAADILPRIRSGELSDVLFVGTGALMNPQALMQGENIVGIAHLVHLKGVK